MFWHTHPMGEHMEPQKSELALACAEAMVVQTLGGRVHVQWDDTASATPHGQLVFFAECLATAGLFEGWVQECPLRYISPNALLTRCRAAPRQGRHVAARAAGVGACTGRVGARAATPAHAWRERLR